MPVTTSHGPSPDTSMNTQATPPGPSRDTSMTRQAMPAITPFGAVYVFPGTRARFGVYQTLVRVFPAAADTAQVLLVTSPGRQKLWMSSAFPTVAGGSPDWFHPAMRNSQLPAAGVPDPSPTEVAGSSAMTVDCSAGGMFWRLAGWLNAAAHWFTTTIAPARVTRPD